MPLSNRLAPATVLFLLLLAFHALFQLAFFAQISFTPDALLEATGVPPDLASNLSGLLAVAAAGQALLVVLSIIAIVWIWQNALPGVVIGIAIGAYFLLLGAALAVLGSAHFATIDIARGALTVLFGVLARRRIAKHLATS